MVYVLFCWDDTLSSALCSCFGLYYWMSCYFLFSSDLSLVWFFFFSSRRRHTRCLSDWSSDVCSSDLGDRLPNACFVAPRDIRAGSGAGARGRLKGNGGVAAVFLLAAVIVKYPARPMREIGRASCRERG